ncbi:MAG: glycosyltransferase family 39 protein [Nitrospirae bacterium]|nr:glycosyltransferase family 39 protein [Nitrospirota bacterium]MBF0535107.1 glycosyltransferase family 39 protein [Nitrospirota bacterium]MBF0615343.1 glycosyltransferase family 39 protein [Nitrospirota bacterium]
MIIVLTLYVYQDTRNFQFLIYDDNRYITANPFVQTGFTKESVKWAFTTDNDGNWFPLTWLSHLTDFQLYGMRPMGHHITSVIIHTLNSLLVFILFAKLLHGNMLQGAIAGALFAIHPMHVESVAWVSERKDVLSAFWFFLTMLSYVSYVRKENILRYMLTLALFVLSLMSKPMAVTLPVLLLLLDFWPLNRFSNVPDARATKKAAAIILEKIPFFVLSAVSCVITVYVQKSGGHLMPLQRFPLSLRAGNALVSYTKYLYLAVYPAGLSNFYPMPESIPALLAIFSAVLIITITTVSLIKIKTMPWLIVGWGWFFISLLPVIGLIQVELQSMADRYTYIPYTGIFVLAVVCVFKLMERFQKLKLPITVFGAIFLLLLTHFARVEASYWRDSLTLTNRAIEVNTKNYMAYYNLGYIKASEGNHVDAFISYKKAISLKPGFGKPYINAGFELLALNKVTDAIWYFKKSIPIAGPNISIGFNGLGIALLRVGKIDEARTAFENALKYDPGMEPARINLDIVNEMLREKNNLIR